uniref:Molybdate-anion transporter n=1 Tax=Mycena chlorophos TaxID=658473 RepID=A0ABQ0LP97_MYCCL|nr:predicted protein [Mycena chlorophos]
MSFYERDLLFLAVACVAGFVLDHHLSKRRKRDTQEETRELEEHAENGSNGIKTASGVGTNALASLSKTYLAVYALVMGADWLQGPYIYSLYHEQYQLPEQMVAVLFVAGFVSAGLAAPLVGGLADQHGRKRLCLIFCGLYISACICILSPTLPILLVGRVLGGTATSILFSAFESWLVSAAHSHGLSSSDLSLLMGRATTLNGFIATVSGVFSNQLVAFSNSFATPFIASAALLVLASILIRSTWSENYGSMSAAKDASSDPFQLHRLGAAWRIVSQDTRLLVLGITQTVFEGSMYLFVFLWVPALQEFSTDELLPLGYIFSALMLSMMLGSLFYSQASTLSPDNSLITHAKLSSCVCVLAALALALAVSQPSAHVRFWAFCLFEACVGCYYPVQGMLRSTLITNDQRATLSALFRVPLNVFVVVSLLTGIESAGTRGAVLSACSVMLGVASVLTGVFIVGAAPT